MAAATLLLDEGGLEAASLSAIARTAKISKANLYRYFESREDILLTVMLEDVEDWFDGLQAELATLEGSTEHEALVEILVASVCARPRLCILVSSLSSVLEHNVSSERISAFKASFHDLALAPMQALARVLPALGAEGAQRFLTHFYVVIAGTWPMTHPPEVVAQVLARAEFRHMALDFETTLRDHARLLLRGLLAPPG